MDTPAYDALKPQHQRFVDGYVESCNASDAYRRAGYKIGTATGLTVNSSRLLAKTSQAIQERRQTLADSRILTLKEKQAMLSEMAKNNYRRENGGDPFVALGAIRELNKMEGDYAPSKHQTLIGQVRFIQDFGSDTRE